MTPTITRKFEFDTGHRVFGHGGKCRHLHGHRYVAEVTIEVTEGRDLDDLGMVADFSYVKAAIGNWIDANWDHATLLSAEDDELFAFLVRTGHRVALVGDGLNPTAENMATTLLAQAQSLLPASLYRVTRVRLYETPNCWADANA